MLQNTVGKKKMASDPARAETAQGEYGSMSNQLGLPENQEDWTDKDIEQLRSFLRDRRKLAQALGYANARCIEPEEAAREAHTRATNVLESWHTLNRIVGRHAEALGDSWMNNSPALRKKILLQAWPGMVDMHRPDLWALRRESQEQRRAGTAYVDAFMWPQINLRDLGYERVPFMVLLNSRARSPPHVFAAADLEAVRVGQLSKAIQGIFLPGHDIIMAGETTETYGKICPQTAEENVEAVAKGASFKAGDGMDVLEIQERLLAFLVKCCRPILDDQDPGGAEGDLVRSIEKTNMLERGFNSRYEDMSDVTLQAPYIDPRDVDLERLETIIRNRLREAETHFQSLHQDPEYFATTARTWIGHAPEHVRERQDNNAHPDMADPSRRCKLLDRIIGRLVHNSYEEIHVWKHLVLQLQELRDLQRQYPGNRNADVVSSEYMEEPQYMQALQKLKALIDMRLHHHYMMKINDHFASCLPQLDNSINEPRDIGPGVERALHRNDPFETPPDDLLWLWNRFSDKEYLHICGVKTLSGEMDRFLAEHPEQTPRVTPFLQRAFSDISMVGGLREQFALLWPRIFAPRSDNDLANRPQIEVVRWGQRLVAPIWGLVQLLNDLNGTANPPIKLGEAGDPDTGRFDCSSPELRPAAKAYLKSFWDGLERDLKTLMSPTEYEDLQKLGAF